MRLNPATPGEAAAPGAVDQADLQIVNLPPGSPNSYPARDIVDAGFLLLVRYGMIAPYHPLVVDSLRVVDATLKCDLPQGPPGSVITTMAMDSVQMGGPSTTGAWAEPGPC